MSPNHDSDPRIGPSSDSVDVAEPDFDADSIQLPDAVSHTERPSIATGRRRSRQLPGAILALVLIAGLGLAAGIWVALASSDAPEAIVADPAPDIPRSTVLAPESDKSPPVAARPEPDKSPPVAARPEPDPPPEMARKKLPAPDPVTAVGAKVEAKEARPELAKPVRKRGPGKAKKGRGRSYDKRMRQVMNRLDSLGAADQPSPEGGAIGRVDEETSGALESPPDEAEPAAEELEANCANGVGKDCVRAGQRAERSAAAKGGARARQLYGIGCTRGLAAGCWRLARLLEHGVGGLADPARASAIRSRACSLGHAPSCTAVRTATTSP